MTRLLLWRHGRTEWNAVGRVQGQTDVDLDPTGLAQAADAAPLLAGLRPDALVSSDLRRALRTADALALATGLPVRTDPRLRERHHGPWQGMTLAEVAARWPEDFRRWGRGEPVGVDGVEADTVVGDRVAAALLDAADTAPGGTVVVVSHGGAVRQGLFALLGWPPTLARTFAGLDNARWAELRRGTRGWRLTGYNLGAYSADAEHEPAGAETADAVVDDAVADAAPVAVTD